MPDDPKDGPEKGHKFSPFSSDSDETGVQEMPTVSSLLRRKKAGATSVIHTPEIEGHLIPTTEGASTGVTLTSTLAVQPTKRQKRERDQLITWHREDLAQSNDPLAAFILAALKAGANQGLFLSIFLPEKAKAPHFKATAYFGDNSLVGVWEGLRWNPSITPVLWKKLIAEGFVDLPPPHADTNVSSERNVARNAVGSGSKGHALIVRVGPPKSCRGLLVMLSDASLAAVVEKNTSMIFAPVARSKPKAA